MRLRACSHEPGITHCPGQLTDPGVEAPVIVYTSFSLRGGLPVEQHQLVSESAISKHAPNLVNDVIDWHTSCLKRLEENGEHEGCFAQRLERVYKSC